MRRIVWVVLVLLGVGAGWAGEAAGDGMGKTLRVALAGSSACQDFNEEDPARIWGWGSVIGRYFTPDVTIRNHARSGRGSKSFITEGRWEALLEEKPAYILMALGANDTPGKKNATDAATEYKDNLRRFAADAERIGAEIIFITPNTSLEYDATKTRAIFNSEGRPVRLDRLAHCRAMREVAAELGKPCLDLFTAQVACFEEMGETEAAGLYRLMDNGRIDPSHTNRRGAELVARLIVCELLSSGSPLARHVLDQWASP